MLFARKKFPCLLLVMLAFLAVRGLSQPPVAINNPETPDESMLIHLGDLIEIDVIGTVEYDWRGTLSPEGLLKGPDAVTERIPALCRSEADVAADFARALGAILRNPVVKVTILDRSNRAGSTLYGAVKSPRRFQIRRRVRLNELLILGGGLTDRANGEIQIFRPASLSCAKPSTNVGRTVTDGTVRSRVVTEWQDNGSGFLNIRITDLLSGNEDANPEILSGDVINVLESPPVYVIGGVVSPKQVPVRTETTLTRVISAAGGLSRDAVPSSVTVYRRAAGETKVVRADLEKIRAGVDADMTLQAFDVVEVGQKGSAGKKPAPVLEIEDLNGPPRGDLPVTIIE